MILIADSGSTKTDWIVVENGNKIHSYKTLGINPYFLDKEDIISIIKSDVNASRLIGNISKIHFYGAGCASSAKSELVKKSLQDVFKGSEINVEHDLLGAARALLNKGNGLVAILGTGSNSCKFDGGKIIQNIPSLGYVLGDEGSGAYLGKILVKEYLNGALNKDLHHKFSLYFNLSSEEILDAIYRKPFPNRFLASFCPFLSKHISNPLIRLMVEEGITDFFETHILKYPDYNSLKVGFVGSIGYCFKDILKDVAKNKNVQLGKILKSPIEGLLAYHT